MCLILLAIESHPVYKLIFAANRDEFYDRPTSQAAFWDESPGLLAGRDLRAGGTWLGITTSGKIAAITNYRDPASLKAHAPSRGKLVSDFLSGRASAPEYLEMLAQKGDEYNGFNLIIGEMNDLYWYSNRGKGWSNLAPQIYGLSNHLLDSPWPKVTTGKDGLRDLLSTQEKLSPEAIFGILSDRSAPDDNRLPDTGVGLELERMLSPLFITSPDYGTRSSTILLVDRNDRAMFIERTFNSTPDHPTTIDYQFRITAQVISLST
ncbi:MAG: NRDE family protein [Thermodesulfobacteriota bacterium]|nr:NRDE family protein [Thermodesulfobacteriota bacterium]